MNKFGDPKRKKDFGDDKRGLKNRVKKTRDEAEPVVAAIAEELEPVEIAGELAPVEIKLKELRANAGSSQSDNSEYIEKVISINRVTKVTKGGKRLSFSALVVVGDGKGNVGYGLEKASEVSIAIRKSIGVAKRRMVRVPMKGTTITHEIIGECGAAEVLLKPAGEGTGVIAAGPVRAVCDGAGISNILTKCHRSNNPINVVKATFDGFSRLKSLN